MASTATGPTASARSAGRSASPALRYAAAFYALTIAFHTADHVRRGIDVVTPEVFWAGIASTIVAFVVIALIFSGNRLAPALAVAVGFLNALGVSAVHLWPRWSAFSDPFPGGNESGVSWAAVLLEIAAALALGVAGLFASRRD